MASQEVTLKSLLNKLNIMKLLSIMVCFKEHKDEVESKYNNYTKSNILFRLLNPQIWPYCTESKEIVA